MNKNFLISRLTPLIYSLPKRGKTTDYDFQKIWRPNIGKEYFIHSSLYIKNQFMFQIIRGRLVKKYVETWLIFQECQIRDLSNYDNSQSLLVVIQRQNNFIYGQVSEFVIHIKIHVTKKYLHWFLIQWILAFLCILKWHHQQIIFFYW